MPPNSAVTGFALVRRWTVRAKTVVSAVAVVAVVLVALSIGLVVTVGRFQLSAVDHSLDLTEAALATLVRSGHVPPTLPVASNDASFTQVLSASGRVVASSASITGEGPLLGVGAVGPLSTYRTVTKLPVGNGGAYRVIAETVSTSQGRLTIVAGTSLDAVNRSTTALAWGLGIVGPLVLVALGAVVWWLVGRALATVEGLREEVATITAKSLHRRVVVPPVADEVGRLALTMNAMLERIERNDRVQRTFVANASHELKSPLAAAQAELEVGLAHDESVDWPDAARAALQDVERMRRIVDDLLTLALVDEGAPIVRQPVDIDELIIDEVTRLRRTSPVTVDSTGVSAGRVDGDVEQLRRVVRNLLDNAVAHAEHAVTVTLDGTQDAIAFRVHDDGSGIAAVDRAKVFERFARLDEDRSRSRGGSGLGLAIVDDVVRAHGGTVTITDDGPGATFVVRLPRSR